MKNSSDRRLDRKPNSILRCCSILYFKNSPVLVCSHGKLPAPKRRFGVSNQHKDDLHKKYVVVCGGERQLDYIKEKRLHHRQLSFKLKVLQKASKIVSISKKANQFQPTKKTYFKRKKIRESAIKC